MSLQISAQSKVGTIDVEFIISKMPQLEQVKTGVDAYSKELEGQAKIKYATYQTLIDAYKQNESSYTDAVKKEKQNEIVALEQDIQKFQQNSTQLVQIKQNELVQPLYKKIGEAMNAIVSEEKFTQIFTIDNSIAYLDPDYDITLKVMKKLGLPLPEEGK